MLEEDEIRGDVKEKLCNLYEGLRGLECGFDDESDPDDDTGSDY